LGERSFVYMKLHPEELMETAKNFFTKFFYYKFDGVAKPIDANGNKPDDTVEFIITDSSDSCSSSDGGDHPSPKRLTKEDRGDAGGTSCLTLSVYSAFVIAMIIIFMIIGRDYIKYLLLSLEETNLWISFVIFTLLFTVVSFPMTWGYILLNVAAGYLYGILAGVLIIIVCALVGITIAHIIIRRFLSDFVMNRLANDSMKALLRVLDGKQGFRVVVLSRLTPIPFGLQNALFAISDLPIHHYILASMLGMLPTQAMHAYIGSTLRSMEEVVASSNNNTAAYIIFSVQLLMAALLLAFVIRKARSEFNKAVQEMDQKYQHPSSPDQSSDLMEKGAMFTKENPINILQNGDAHMSPRNVKIHASRAADNQSGESIR